MSGQRSGLKEARQMNNDFTSTSVPHPPRSKREVVVDVMHGVEIPDPYRWLEDQGSEEARSWIESQNQ
jgi:protease II